MASHHKSEHDAQRMWANDKGRIQDLEERFTALVTSSDRLELLGAILDAFDNTIVVTNPNKLDNPIIYVNGGFEKLTGYGPGEVIGQNCRFLQGEDHDQEGVEQLREAVRAGESVDVELRNYRKDGAVFYNHLSLVEDEQDDIDLTIRALHCHNLINDIVVLQDGAVALDFLLRRGEYAERVYTLPQFVLLDINLPKLSGLDVLSELRQDERTRLLPIVMLTTSQEEHDVVQSYANGANSYVRKPVDFEAFSEAIRQLGVYWLVLNENPWPAAT